uniref:Uncharacterized protein n=1 Tax=Arundo donax TaxID=35708 RepID=A0A0A9CCJ0_ARUDO
MYKQPFGFKVVRICSVGTTKTKKEKKRKREKKGNQTSFQNGFPCRFSMILHESKS